jgi:hypothetical protein
MKQNIVLIPSKTNKGYDTLILSTSKDRLEVNIDGKYKLEIPNKKINVETPGKDWFDYTLGTITILGAIIAAYYTWKSIRKLYEKDEDKQAQIDKLSSIAEKMGRQNAILEEANLLISKQVDVLRNLTIGSNDSESSKELLKIEREKLELEHRPRLFSNMFMSAESSGGYKIENGGKQFTILSVEPDQNNIQLINNLDLIGKTIPEQGFFNIQTRTKDGSVMHDKNFNVIIVCENDLGMKYQIVMNSQKMDSLRTSTKIEDHE